MPGDPAAPPLVKRALWKLARVFARPAFQVVVFMAALVLFYWPLMTADAAWSSEGLFVYYFGAWAAVVVLLMVVGLSLALLRRLPDRDSGGDGPRP